MSDDAFNDERRPLVGLRASTVEGLRVVWRAGPVMASALTVVSVVEGLIPIAFTVASGRLVKAASAGGGGLTLWLVAVAGLFLVGETTGHVRFAVLEGFRGRVEGRRRERVMAAALRPPGIGHLEDPLVLDDVRQAAKTDWPDTAAFTSGVFGMMRTRTTALAATAALVTFRWWVALGLLLFWIWAGRILRAGQVEAWAGSSAGRRRAEYLREVAFELRTAKEVRLFSFGGWLIEGFDRVWRGVMEEVWRRRRLKRRQQLAVLLPVVAVHVVAFAALAQAATTGELTTAGLVVLVPAVLSLSQWGQLDEWTYATTLGAVALPTVVKVERLLGDQGPFALSGSASAADLPRHLVRFEGVTFTYPGRHQPVYDSLDLQIEAGRSMAIVGANGAGKTTLVKLLARLYEPTAGSITVDGVDLRELDARQWQRRVAAVFQDFVHYELPARDNVAFANVDAEPADAALWRAAKRAGADDLIAGLERGWDTVLSRRFQGGTDLSGGEWQRLALARAVYAVDHGAGILVLDEPTANLDARAEVELFDRFLEVTAGATTILISHRFSTVRRADRIVVLDHGRVVEDGKHEALLASGGYYARAFRLQADRYGEPIDLPAHSPGDPEPADA